MKKVFNEEAHLSQMEATIGDLIEVAKKLGHPAPQQLQYLGTAVDNTAGGVVSAFNALSDSPKRLHFTHHNNWKSLMGSVHRNFFNSLMACVEEGLKDWCSSNQMTVKPSKREQMLKLISKIEKTIPLTNRQKSKLLSFTGIIPSFMDYFEEATVKLNTGRRNHWRTWFQGLLIIRNVSSHSNRELTDNEIRTLELGGFKPLISGRIISSNTSAYRPTIDQIIIFYDELLGYKADKVRN